MCAFKSNNGSFADGDHRNGNGNGHMDAALKLDP